MRSWRRTRPATARPRLSSPATTPARGIDLYLSTSSAGGGLQMTVAGVVRQMSAESAERAALSAGAIVMDAISADDGREDHERIQRLRHLRPDIVLLTGGVDGGSQEHVVEMAETLVAASPRPRFGDSLRLPVIYAGNSDATEDVRRILEKTAQVAVVDNVRPTLEAENLSPAREAIHEFFLAHVMSHSPGYDKLLRWTPVPVMPTPAAVGDMVRGYAEATGRAVLCVDIGGATTDVFSVFENRRGEPVFNRTVSANLGMSYSVANVLIEAGVESIRRWLPYGLEPPALRDRLRNKMIRPTSIPQTLEDLWLEQAVCREALRLALFHHRSLAVGLSGVQQQRGIADIFCADREPHGPGGHDAPRPGHRLGRRPEPRPGPHERRPHDPGGLRVAGLHADRRRFHLHDAPPGGPRLGPSRGRPGNLPARLSRERRPCRGPGIPAQASGGVGAGARFGERQARRERLRPAGSATSSWNPAPPCASPSSPRAGASTWAPAPARPLNGNSPPELCGVVLDGRNRPLRTPASTEEQVVERDAVMAELGLAVS